MEIFENVRLKINMIVILVEKKYYEMTFMVKRKLISLPLHVFS